MRCRALCSDRPDVRSLSCGKVEAGVDVLREGDAGDLAYWVEEGQLSVVVGGIDVDTIGKDTVFGEVALIYDLNRTATIRASTKCSMWLLHRSMFQHILRGNAIAERKLKFSFLKTVKIFASLSHREISRITDVMEEHTFLADEVMIKEGEEADSMYIIQEGQAVVSQALDSETDDKSLLRILKEGDYFGEKALLTDGSLRTATVTAASKVTSHTCTPLPLSSTSSGRARSSTWPRTAAHARRVCPPKDGALSARSMRQREKTRLSTCTSRAATDGRHTHARAHTHTRTHTHAPPACPMRVAAPLQ